MINQKITRTSFLSLPSLESIPPIDPDSQLFSNQALLLDPTQPFDLPLRLSPEEESSMGRPEQSLMHSQPRGRQLKGCNCKKTLCLKMYCECFALGKLCGGDCKCFGCHNTQIHQEEIQEALSHIRESSIKRATLAQKHCNCKKTKCLKRYCECYSSGVGCTEACNCCDCSNRDLNIGREEESSAKSIISNSPADKRGQQGDEDGSLDIFEMYLN